MDTLGLLLKVKVHTADIQDRVGSMILIYDTCCKFPSLKKIFADGGYTGKLIDWVLCICKVVVEVIKRNTLHTFEILPKRWIVERTFAWLGRNRRLSKHYEQKPENAEGWVYLGMTRLMLKRLNNKKISTNTS